MKTMNPLNQEKLLLTMCCNFNNGGVNKHILAQNDWIETWLSMKRLSRSAIKSIVNAMRGIIDVAGQSPCLTKKYASG